MLRFSVTPPDRPDEGNLIWLRANSYRYLVLGTERYPSIARYCPIDVDSEEKHRASAIG